MSGGQSAEKGAGRPSLRDALGNARVVFWVCPIREHGERRNERGGPVVTVEWIDGVAHCTAPGCDLTSVLPPEVTP